jgi:hypothetical protein
MSPLELLCSSIATSEGFFAPGDNLPKTNHNPGDLRASPLNRFKDKNGFVKFQSDPEGIAALYHQVTLMALRGMTPRQIITVWAPPTGADGGNNTDAYIASVARWTGLDMDKPLWFSLPVENMYVKFHNPS